MNRGDVVPDAGLFPQEMDLSVNLKLAMTAEYQRIAMKAAVLPSAGGGPVQCTLRIQGLIAEELPGRDLRNNMHFSRLPNFHGALNPYLPAGNFFPFPNLLPRTSNFSSLPFFFLHHGSSQGQFP